jgi:hypothetical protein
VSWLALGSDVVRHREAEVASSRTPRRTSPSWVDSLLDLRQDGQGSGELTKKFGKNLDGFGEAVARIAHPGALDRIGDSLLHDHPPRVGLPDLDEARDKIKAIDEPLKSLVRAAPPMSRPRPSTSRPRPRLRARRRRSSAPCCRVRDALTAADTQTKLAADSQAKLGEQAGLTADQLQDQRTEAEKLSDALKGLNGTPSARPRGDLLPAVAGRPDKAVKENGHSLDVTTRRAARSRARSSTPRRPPWITPRRSPSRRTVRRPGRSVLEKDIGLLKRQMSAAGLLQGRHRQADVRLRQAAGVDDDEGRCEDQEAMTDLEAVKKKVAAHQGQDRHRGG